MVSFESDFPKDYRRADIEQLLTFVLAGKFCQLISLPGGGKATVLKLLANNKILRKFHLGAKEKSIHFIYLNLLELPDFEQATINKFLLINLDKKGGFSTDPILLAQELKTTVNQLITKTRITLVFLFDHFDEYQNQLSRLFFQSLKSLRSVAKYKFVVVFATRRELTELVDEDQVLGFYDFFVGNAVYMKLLDQSALDFMLGQIEVFLHKKLEAEEKQAIITLTGGHTKLTRVCAESVLGDKTNLALSSLLEKPLIQATLFELWLFLTPEEQRVLIDVSKNKKVESVSALESLMQFDLLKKPGNGKNFCFTIPLFEQFVKQVVPTLGAEKIVYDEGTKEIKKGQTMLSDLLSSQEYRLLKFLIENQEQIIERQVLIQAVWPDNKSSLGITDQAIDQMMFRLRKKIEDEPNNPNHVVTVKGRGFRFIA